MFPQDMHSERVEGADEWSLGHVDWSVDIWVFSETRFYSVAHLLGRFVGEGDGKDRRGVDPATNQVSDPFYYCLGFPSASASKDQDWSFCG